MTTVEVYKDIEGKTVAVGHAYFTRQRGRVSTTFVYDTSYLASGGASIDPALPLVTGAQYSQGLIRAFADGAPDRWGRNLIEKAERVRARQEKRAPRSLDDVDFLLGVSDDTRQGALRYRHPDLTAFIGDSVDVPQLISLPELLRASDEMASEDDPAHAIKQLLNTGTTGLGGARPKASVRLEDGALGIAKFPHASDRWDVMAWEATALDLLEEVGVKVPSRRLTKVGGRSVLILRRFDRAEGGNRIGYISGMTALGATDGEHRDYEELALVMRDLSFSMQKDHHELFDRVVVSVGIGNTDDHLRNHGFLERKNLWELSPVFDVNPNPVLRQSRSTSIMGADRVEDEADALLAFAEKCSLSQDDAKQRILSIVGVLSHWKEIASRHSVQQKEVTMFAEAMEQRLESLHQVATAQ